MDVIVWDRKKICHFTIQNLGDLLKTLYCEVATQFCIERIR